MDEAEANISSILKHSTNSHIEYQNIDNFESRETKEKEIRLKNYFNRKKFIFSINLLTIKYNSLTDEWTKFEDNPVLGNSQVGTVFDPFVIKNNSEYKMYVSWRKKGAIALSTSKDGYHWSKLKIILNKGDKNSWESIVNRATLVEFNNKFYLWYTGQYNGKSKIGLAISKDGYNFIKYKNNPVLIPEKHFEKESVMNPNIIYDYEKKLFKMWYAAGETYEPDVICYAESKDGINWRKYEHNPIFAHSLKNSSLDSFKVGGCDIHKISNNRYLMFYIGYSDINTARIFVAENRNGINNWRRSKNPIIKPDKKKFDSKACYKPSALYDNKKKVWTNFNFI